MHGILTLALSDINQYPRPAYVKTIAQIGPGYSKEEEQAFNELFDWLKFGRGLFVNASWSPDPTSIKPIKHLTPEQLYKRKINTLRNKLQKSFPLFWEEIFEQQKQKIDERFGK